MILLILLPCALLLITLGTCMVLQKPWRFWGGVLYRVNEAYAADPKADDENYPSLSALHRQAWRWMEFRWRVRFNWYWEREVMSKYYKKARKETP